MLRISKEELIELYVNQKLSLLAIARQVGYANESCVAYARDKYGIPARPQAELKIGKHYSPTTEFKKGCLCGYRPKKGERLSCSGWNKGLTKAVDTRIQSQAQKVSQKLKGGTHQDAQYAFGKEFYHDLYWVKGLSLQGIADELGCDLATVAYYFTKYGIPRRKAFEAVRRKPTTAELRLTALIETHKLPYRYVGNGKVWFEGACPDFININGAKGIIELFGDYWHTTKIKHWSETEGGRIHHFTKFGFKTLIIWENELKDEKAVVKKIKTFTKGLAGVL